ncbi:MAG: D-glycerate dehydrogenase, partial [Chloroflexi bacterium]|nr:D-glycerate dehydrogenase [Chloroflexota bacterium]
MPKPRVFVTRIIPEKGLNMIRAACDVVLWEDELPPSHAVIHRESAGMDGLLCL